jgi:DNA-binding CsgD family transcriptional regulator
MKANSSSIIFIRQLCALGLDPRSLAPALLPAIRRVIPAHSAAFFWVDANAQITNLYAERMLAPEIMANYFRTHYRRAENEFASRFRERAAAEGQVTAVTLDDAERETPYYREVLSRLEADRILYAVVGRRPHPVGQLSLYRSRSDEAFSAAEQDVMRGLLGYLERGLGATSAGEPEQLIDSRDEALGVVNPDGNIRYAPPDWVRLMQLAAREEIGASGGSDLVSGMRGLVSKVLAANGAELVVGNPWGRFRLRSYRLSDEASPGSWAIFVGRAEAQELALVRGAEAARLSPQQREVALLIARGLTNQEIAAHLGLSANTADYHVKQVFAQLDVHGREAVVEALMRYGRKGE